MEIANQIVPYHFNDYSCPAASSYPSSTFHFPFSARHYFPEDVFLLYQRPPPQERQNPTELWNVIYHCEPLLCVRSSQWTDGGSGQHTEQLFPLKPTHTTIRSLSRCRRLTDLLAGTLTGMSLYSSASDHLQRGAIPTYNVLLFTSATWFHVERVTYREQEGCRSPMIGYE